MDKEMEALYPKKDYHTLYLERSWPVIPANDEEKSGGTRRAFQSRSMDRSLLHGLACEWEKSLWLLSPSHRKMMRPPLFSLGRCKTGGVPGRGRSGDLVEPEPGS